MSDDKKLIRQEMINKGLIKPAFVAVGSTTCMRCAAKFEFVLAKGEPDLCGNCEHPQLSRSS